MDLNKLQDIQLNEIDLRSQYYNYFLNGDIVNSTKVITDNPQLNSKVLNSSNLNKLIEGILSLEQEYYDNIDNVLQNDLNSFNISIDDLVYLSEWNVDTLYDKNNFVIYENEIYYAYKDNKGILPTNQTYWIYLGLRGQSAFPSLGVNYIGQWGETISYKQYDMVAYNNRIYVAISDNVGIEPTDNTKWFLAMEQTLQGIFVSKTEPINIQIGQIWIKLK